MRPGLSFDGHLDKKETVKYSINACIDKKELFNIQQSIFNEDGSKVHLYSIDY